MLDYKQLEAYSAQSLLQIKTALSINDNVRAKIWLDLWSKEFIAHVSGDFGVKMSCPNYILKIAREISSLQPIEVTIAP